MSEVKVQKNIFLCSADAQFRSLFQQNLALHGYKIIEAKSEKDVLAFFEQQEADMAFLDIEKTEHFEMDLVNFIKSRSPRTEIVVVANIEKLDQATQALRTGAAFYLIKPFDQTYLSVVLGKLKLKVEQQEQYIELERRVLEDTMSGSSAMRKALNLCYKIAPTTSTVLISGESGTGKEFFAKIIHRMSRRTDGPFVPVNCGAIPDTLFESEMFGHKKGSFTGADRDKIGLTEQANLGTLFLDEVGELSPPAQVKLLRFLQERSVRRVGETTARQINVRIIAATNKTLVDAVREGRFREDLFYRLNVFHITLPPLRDRKETIPYLLKIMIHKHNLAMDKRVSKITKETELLLASYDYPGNIRELENIVEHAMTLASGDELRAQDLPEFMLQNQPRLMAPQQRQAFSSDILPLAEMEKQHIQLALERFHHNSTETAKALGVSRSTLWRKIKEYKLDKP